MEIWLLLVGYAVLFGLLQVLVYVYYQRSGGRERSPRTTTPADPPATTAAAPDPQPDAEVDPDVGRRCPHCGTPNEADAMFSYCRNCARQLGG